MHSFSSLPSRKSAAYSAICGERDPHEPADFGNVPENFEILGRLDFFNVEPEQTFRVERAAHGAVLFARHDGKRGGFMNFRTSFFSCRAMMLTRSRF
jgi:hypothetical protein